MQYVNVQSAPCRMWIRLYQDVEMRRNNDMEQSDAQPPLQWQFSKDASPWFLKLQQHSDEGDMHWWRASRGRSERALPHICETWTPWVSINLSIMTGGQAAPPIQQSLSMPLRLKSFASQCSSRPAITVGTAAVTETLCSKIRSATDLPSSLGPEQFRTLVKGVRWWEKFLQIMLQM